MLTGTEDLFVARFTRSGTHLWSTTIGDSTNQLFIGLDAGTGALVAGAFTGTVDFGSGPVTSQGFFDGFVAKFSSVGTDVWSRVYGASSTAVTPVDIAGDATGSSVSCGFFQGTIDFGAGPKTSSGFDIYILKLDSNGTPVWSITPSAMGTDAARDVALDDGNAIITGSYENSIDLGGGTLMGTAPSNTFLAKFSAGGAHLWSRKVADSDSLFVWDVAIGPDSSIVVVGQFEGQAQFGSEGLSSEGGNDAFVAKFDSLGELEWVKRAGNFNEQYATAAVVDALGNIVVVGTFTGSIDFGDPVSSAGGEDFFVAKLSADGTPLWSKAFGDGGAEQQATDVAIDSNSNVLVLGYFNGSIVFGDETVTSQGGTDGFLLALSP